jgi:hypothetical protein
MSRGFLLLIGTLIAVARVITEEKGGEKNAEIRI